MTKMDFALGREPGRYYHVFSVLGQGAYGCVVAASVVVPPDRTASQSHLSVVSEQKEGDKVGGNTAHYPRPVAAVQHINLRPSI